MPLPDSAPLSLQVNSNAVQSRPKRAMIVRMSTETFDALDAFPSKMSFEFGDNPGIYIGDAFFPVRPQKESSPHELYLRASTAAKPMAPLKLYANVIGKFTVERQLGDKVTDKVRQQTMAAKRHHMERQAILLDQPPIPVPGAKNGKRKVPGSGTMIKKIPPSDQLRVASSSTVASRRVSPLPQNTPSAKAANADIRRRLVHCLAMSPRLADEAVKMVGGATVSPSAREDLLALLDDVAEQPPTKKGDKSPRLWALKPQTWTEVRPYEWPKLTESERTNMARQARMILKALKIPESDPAWDNVRYRQTGPAIPTSVPPPPSIAASSSSRSSTSAQAEPKRSVIPSKDAKLQSKQGAPRTKGEIQVKDESSASISRMNGIKRAEAERSSTASESNSGAKTSRRLPGSGYQAKKSPLPTTAGVEKSGTSTDPRSAPKPPLPVSLPQKPPHPGGTHARKTIPTMPPKATKKEDESDRERDREYERQREREREKRAREKEKQREEWEREQERAELEKREKARQKEREEKREREKEREREEMERERRQKEKERILKERAISNTVPAFKRKMPAQDAEGTFNDVSSKSAVPKRRKLDDGTSATSSSKVRDVVLPKKPVQEPSPVARFRMKKDPSPPVPSQERRAPGGSAHKFKASGSIKVRRRSPIYTSSEDEGEIPQPRNRNPSPPPVSDRSISSDQPSTEKVPRHHRTARTPFPSPTDHAALRALYQSQYTSYLVAFGKVVAQKRKIEAMLNGDSEAEMDMMDPDELLKLNNEYMSLKTDLERIHEIYTKGTAVAVGAGGLTPD